MQCRPLLGDYYIAAMSLMIQSDDPWSKSWSQVSMKQAESVWEGLTGVDNF